MILIFIETIASCAECCGLVEVMNIPSPPSPDSYYFTSALTMALGSSLDTDIYIHSSHRHTDNNTETHRYIELHHTDTKI